MNATKRNYRATFILDNRGTEDTIEKIIEEVKHSRIPVFEGTEDNIIGIINSKALLKALKRAATEKRQTYSALAEEWLEKGRADYDAKKATEK